MATKEVLRTVQPAHKSERITTAKAKKAWQTVERSSSTGRFTKATKATSAAKTRAGTKTTASSRTAATRGTARTSKTTTKKR